MKFVFYLCGAILVKAQGLPPFLDYSYVQCTFLQGLQELEHGVPCLQIKLLFLSYLWCDPCLAQRLAPPLLTRAMSCAVHLFAMPSGIGPWFVLPLDPAWDPMPAQLQRCLVMSLRMMMMTKSLTAAAWLLGLVGWFGLAVIVSTAKAHLP